MSLLMGLSSKVLLTSFPTILAQKQNSEIVKPNVINFNSTRNTQNWSIAHNHMLASSPSKHFKNLTEYPSHTDNQCIQHVQKLKAFILSKEDSFEGLAMIDAIQRLGIDHYFQEEIEAILQRHYKASRTHSGAGNDLHEVALRFRLLRQEGYHVPAGVFDNYKDKEGNFMQNLSGNIKGLMALYEASQLRTRGEYILDEAEEYSYKLLNSWLTQADYHHGRQVRNTLEHPHHKSLARFMAKNIFSYLEGANGWLNALKELAMFDFKMVQCQHQKEIVQISTWWKDLGLCKELKFARDQPLRWHMWSMACLTGPSLSEQRIDLTKPISFIYIIDDIFDVFGSLDELTLFTEVVNRWDIAATEQLPDYMKLCFEALNHVTNEISYKVYKEHGWNPVDSLRKTWARLCNAFLIEANWFAHGLVPNAEEYLQNGAVSSGVHVVLVHIFFLLGKGITKENVELIDNNPGIISSTATILRLWDDLGSAKDEDQDGHDGSYIECYMKEHQGSSIEDARKHVIHMISEAWKQLNQECLSPNPFSSTFTETSLNMARMVPLMYSYDNNGRLPGLEEHVKSLLFESVSM